MTLQNTYQNQLYSQEPKLLRLKKTIPESLSENNNTIYSAIEIEQKHNIMIKIVIITIANIIERKN